MVIGGATTNGQKDRLEIPPQWHQRKKEGSKIPSAKKGEAPIFLRGLSHSLLQKEKSQRQKKKNKGDRQLKRQRGP